ncbi:MAG: AMP-binding protein [Rhodocyclaceae bacterium]|nr:AMP-binding protein [Rhodocyclaceae bacterium]
MQPLSAWLRRADPRTPALILPDRRLGYGEARALAARPGLALPEGGADAIALSFLAAGLGGGTIFPLPPGLAPGRRAQMIAQARALASKPPTLIISTSGSEGAPRGVRLSWRAVAAAARMSGAAVGLAPGDVWLDCLPLHHIGGAMIPYRCWRAGATALIHDGFDPENVLRDLADRRVTHVSLVPPMLSRLLEAGVLPPLTLRCALVGGAALSNSLSERATRLHWPVSTTYGMTETCAMATLDGRPLPGVRVRANDGGALEIATPARMEGYLGGPDVGEWIETGDMGAVDADGRVHVTGRADDMLVSAGVNVHPAEVESRLSACPGVREACVGGLADLVWGDVIAAAWEGEADESDVETWCRQQMPDACRPRRFLRMGCLPRTAGGKPDRRALASLMGKP